MQQGHEGTAASVTPAPTANRAAASSAEQPPPLLPTLHTFIAGKPLQRACLVHAFFPNHIYFVRWTSFCVNVFLALPAERQFSRDLAYALWLPLVLAAFAARSCGHSPAACAAQHSQGWTLEGFPCGGNAAAQASWGRGCGAYLAHRLTSIHQALHSPPFLPRRCCTCCGTCCGTCWSAQLAWVTG